MKSDSKSRRIHYTHEHIECSWTCAENSHFVRLAAAAHTATRVLVWQLEWGVSTEIFLYFLFHLIISLFCSPFVVILSDANIVVSVCVCQSNTTNLWSAHARARGNYTVWRKMHRLVCVCVCLSFSGADTWIAVQKRTTTYDMNDMIKTAAAHIMNGRAHALNLSDEKEKNVFIVFFLSLEVSASFYSTFARAQKRRENENYNKTGSSLTCAYCLERWLSANVCAVRM